MDGLECRVNIKIHRCIGTTLWSVRKLFFRMHALYYRYGEVTNMKNYKKIKGEDLQYLEASDLHPANTYFHFSFARYHDPNNMNFGVLRVLNDDNVKP